MNKIKFGDWLTLQISKQHGNVHALNRLVRVDAGYFNFSGVAGAAQSIDKAVFQAKIEGRNLNPLESFAVEVLVAMGGMEDIEAAQKKYVDDISRVTQ